MSEAGNIIFANLPLLFAVGVAIGMAKKEKEVAALSAVIAFFIMHASINAMIEIFGGEGVLLAGATISVVGILSDGRIWRNISRTWGSRTSQQIL